jgi:hypothetical protein
MNIDHPMYTSPVGVPFVRCSLTTLTQEELCRSRDSWMRYDRCRCTDYCSPDGLPVYGQSEANCYGRGSAHSNVRAALAPWHG